LQAMQKRVEGEGAKEQVLFDKYMCYCKNSGGDLSKSIGDANTKVPQLASDIKESEAKLAQLKEDVKQHQMDRSAAKQAVADATALREKEAGEYAKEASESGANIASVNSAIKALEKGMAGGFLQTRSASVLRHLVSKQDLLEEDRQALNAFLQGGDQYVPSGGQITGILKTMHDEMSKSFADAKAAEAAAISAFDQLMAAKTKEINALSHAIETKMARTGELAVEVVQMKNDLTDTQEALIQDQAFLGDMEKNCAKKTAEWETIVNTRSAELLALADTIKVLNDDDALELFKKALPSASASFVQVNVNADNARLRAMVAIRTAQQTSKSDRPELDFIAMAIQGKKIGFEKVISMIDGMVVTLKKEQTDDDHKKEYCAKQFDFSDDKKKGLEQSLSDTETVIEEAKDGIATTKAEIESLEAGIKSLDKAVAEATEQRQQEHEEFTELMASDSAAKEILGFARNRLNKFYNPKQYVAPAAMLSQIKAHGAAAPPPPPEAPAAYEKKSGESGGVIAMIDTLVKDLTKEMTVAETEEKDAQGDYETTMKDSASKRADDSKTLADKQGALADMQASLQTNEENHGSTTKELGATHQYIASLHAECDWLLQYLTYAERHAQVRSMHLERRRPYWAVQTSPCCR